MPGVASEVERLRVKAESVPADPRAMAAYARFLKYKVGDGTNGDLWQRRATEALAAKLSPTLAKTETYFHVQHI